MRRHLVSRARAMHPWTSVVLAALGVSTAACSLDLGTVPSSNQGPADAGPPALCTAGPSAVPFCAPGAGVCPLVADDEIQCPDGALLSTGNGAGPGTIASAAHGGDVVFAVQGGGPQNPRQYVELATFDSTGAGTFTIDTFDPVPYEASGASNASLAVLAPANGELLLLSTMGNDLRAAVSPSSGGAFTTEQAATAPGSGYGGWGMAGSGVEPSGAVDVLLRATAESVLARRDPSGTWTTSPAPVFDAPPAFAIDPKGVVTMAGWVTVTSATTGDVQLEVVVGSAPPVVLTMTQASNVTSVQVAIGRASDGSPLPVIAYGTPALTLAVPNGSVGFETFTPQLAVAKPYMDGCQLSLSLGNCSCPSTCSITGDRVASMQLVRDAQGDVYLAWLDVDEEASYPVKLNSTSVGGQMLTCSCDPDFQGGTDSSSAVGMQLERLVLTPQPHLEHRGTVPVPAATRSLQIADGNGTLQILAPGTAVSSFRRVVLDASKLP